MKRRLVVRERQAMDIWDGVMIAALVSFMLFSFVMSNLYLGEMKRRIYAEGEVERLRREVDLVRQVLPTGPGDQVFLIEADVFYAIKSGNHSEESEERQGKQ